MHPFEVWGDEWEAAVDATPPPEPIAPRRFAIVARERAAAHGVPINGVLPDRVKRCSSEKRGCTVQEVADVFGISYERVRRAVQRGEIPALKAGVRVLIPRRWLEGRWPISQHEKRELEQAMAWATTDD